MIPAIVEVSWLVKHSEAILVDVRWVMGGPSPAEFYAQEHLPGARFVDLDTQLAAPPSKQGGRHPLPAPADFARAMSELGISNDSVVVCYDDAGGFSAGRLVWMLRALGTDAALLNGGMSAWQGELSTEPAQFEPAEFICTEWPAEKFVPIEVAMTSDQVLDARTAERYRGEVEPTDAEPGHIPGAKSAPLWENLAADGKYFLPADQLRERFVKLGITDASEVVCYCGSGVSACHNLIAMSAAGLGEGKLYVGSWSAYSASGQPIAKGAEPGEHCQPVVD